MKATGETEDRDRPRELYAARPSRLLGSWPVIAIGAVLTVAGTIATSAASPCNEFSLAVELAGSDRRLAGWLSDCTADLGAGRTAILTDFVLIAGYVLLLASIVRRWWPLYHAPGLKRIERGIVLVPFAAGALDIIENTLLLIGVDVRGGRFALPERMAFPIVIATVAWLKWLLVAVAMIAAVMALMLAFARRNERDAPRLSPADDPGAMPRGGGGRADELGICCSGGGIRAAAFSLGAMQRMEQAGVMDRARWLTAVSGGSYAATAWRLLKADDPSRPAADDIVEWLTEPIPGSSGGRHRFLRNGPGGLGRPILAALIYILFNVVVLGAFVYLVAWPIGWLLGSPAVQPVLRARAALPQRLDIVAELWLPGLLLVISAGVVLLLSALPSWKVASLWKVSAALLALAAVLEFVLVLLPLAMVLAGRWLNGGTASLRATAVGGSAFVAALGAVWRIARKPVISQISTRLPELGGFLLAFVAFIWAGKVATDSAIDAGAYRSVVVWLIVVVVFGFVYSFIDTSELSIHRIYRKRLRRTFGLARNVDDGRVHSPRQEHQLRWDQMPDSTPELVICCAQQRTGIAPGGLPAETFTISRRDVRIGDAVVPTDEYMQRLPGRLGTEQYVSSWIATSGAAFASAMGRLSKGSTNALLAAFNIDLGIWLPNPRLVGDPNASFTKVRLGYLFKEILGWYDPGDRYVFVADGGHWENLGLVELLRRRCTTIICVDASGDSIGAFTTLREAVELAGLELPSVVHSIDLGQLGSITGAAGALPTGIVATLRVSYWDEQMQTTFDGVIHYAKAQLASDLDIGIRRYAKSDPRFPNYSTGNQFLTNEQFSELVSLGHEAGNRLVDLVSSPPPTAPAAPQP
ncbi:MAG: hypothetical protein ABIR32_10960 [Ilumatobacteraceae bacterium]